MNSTAKQTEDLIGNEFGNGRVRVEGSCPMCGAENPLGSVAEKEFYFRVFDDGDAMVMVIDHNGNYNQHMSTDETEGDGDGAFGPYHWNDAQVWSKTTREHAESMLKFKFTDLEDANHSDTLNSE